MSGAFQQIQQAMGTPKGRTARARHLPGFVAEALRRSGQVAPVAQVAQPAK